MRKSENIFTSFLQKYCSTIGKISEEEIAQRGVFPGSSIPLQFTTFKAIDDTFMYSVLLSRLLNIFSPSAISTLIDLGAGDSIPTIRALSNNPHHQNLNIIAVDNDPEALIASEENITKNGFRGRYSLVEMDMIEFLQNTDYNPTQVLASNPPYLPVPENVTESMFKPVNGGPDGTKYLNVLLSFPIPSGNILVIEWSSLSNPSEVIQLIEEKYEVVYIQAARAPFGTYTGSKPLRPYLESQRESGKSVFETDTNGQHFFTFVGSILRRK